MASYLDELVECIGCGLICRTGELVTYGPDHDGPDVVCPKCGSEDITDDLERG